MSPPKQSVRVSTPHYSQASQHTLLIVAVGSVLSAVAVIAVITIVTAVTVVTALTVITIIAVVAIILGVSVTVPEVLISIWQIQQTGPRAVTCCQGCENDRDRDHGGHGRSHDPGHGGHPFAASGHSVGETAIDHHGEENDHRRCHRRCHRRDDHGHDQTRSATMPKEGFWPTEGIC